MIGKTIFLFCLCVLGQGCGVRGDPSPPITPAEIGRGHPSYKGYSQDYTPAAKVTGDTKESEEEESSE
jgi:hypothetical protein